jgi:hypothetical protein
METITIKGYLVERHGEGGGLYVARNGSADDPLADELSWQISGKQVSVRFATSAVDDWPDTLEEVLAGYIAQLDGEGFARHGVHYSDLTGYLWTDEDLKIGGHDLLAELYGQKGKFLWLEIKVHD